MFKKSYYDSGKIKKELNFGFTPTAETLQRIAAIEQAGK